MRYEKLGEGLGWFTDFATQEIAEDPVYFPHHAEDPSRIYERASIQHSFEDARINFMKLNWLQEAAAGNRLLEHLMEDEGLRKVVEQNAGQFLGDYTIADILALNYEQLSFMSSIF